MYFDKNGLVHDDSGFWYKFLDRVEETSMA